MPSEKFLDKLKALPAPQFAKESVVRHLKSGGLYKIIDLGRIEATLEVVYIYQSLQTQDVWVRPQSEMEDGRFEAT